MEKKMDKYKISITKLRNCNDSKTLIESCLGGDYSMLYNGMVLSTEEIASTILNNNTVFIIEYADNSVGLLTLSSEYEIRLFINPEYQHIGIGTNALKLVEYLLMDDENCNRIEAYVTEDNRICIQMLNHEGYNLSGEEKEVNTNNKRLVLNKYVKRINNSQM